jgi:hypothetical protein
MTREQAEQIAQEAAKGLGRDWDALPAHSRDIWIEAARNDEPWLKRQPDDVDDDQPEENGADEDQPKTKKRGKK